MFSLKNHQLLFCAICFIYVLALSEKSDQKFSAFRVLNIRKSFSHVLISITVCTNVERFAPLTCSELDVLPWDSLPIQNLCQKMQFLK